MERSCKLDIAQNYKTLNTWNSKIKDSSLNWKKKIMNKNYYNRGGFYKIFSKFLKKKKCLPLNCFPNFESSSKRKISPSPKLYHGNSTLCLIYLAPLVQLNKILPKIVPKFMHCNSIFTWTGFFWTMGI